MYRKIIPTQWARDMFELLHESTRFNLYSASPMRYRAGTPLSPFPQGNFYGEAFEWYLDDGALDRSPQAVFNQVWQHIDSNWNLMRAAVGLPPQ